MPVLIKQLTDAQRARFPEFVERWTQIGLSTCPADRPRAEASVREMYVRAGLNPPSKIVWCGSPLSQGLTRAIILDKKPASVRASVRDSVWASVWASVGASVWASVWASVRDSVWASAYGQHDASWLAFYQYFSEVLALQTQTEKLSGLWELAQSAGWALPHKDICWISERHNILARDDLGRLHSLGGPACAYPDGWAIYAVHGVRVPSFVVDKPGDITAHVIDSETNSEVRRVMIDQYRRGEEVSGSAAYIRDVGGKRLDHDEHFGTLWRREVRDDEPIVMLEVVNSTPEPTGEFKRYWLRVDPSCQTSREASAWTFNLKPDEYAPLIET